MEIVRSAQMKGKRSIFVCDRQTLVNQTSKRFDQFGILHGVTMGAYTRGRGNNTQVASAQTLEKRKFWFTGDRKPDLVVIDECFSPDVEILTSRGFVRFDKLREGEPVAQWKSNFPHSETGDITFVVPDKVIVKPYNGNLVRLQSDSLIDLSMTPNHEMITYTPDGNEKREPAESVGLSSARMMPVSGHGRGAKEILPPRERLMIALQADGNIHYTRTHGPSAGETILAFTLAKDRKLSRLRTILKDCGLRFREEVQSRKRTRIFVYGVMNASKNLWDSFNLPSLSSNAAQEIIHEMVNWDGHMNKDGGLYFSSTNKTQADFYQAVATLAGHKARMTVQHDNRKVSNNDVWRVFISPMKSTVNTRHIKRSYEPYNGKVYCVRVPTGNIVVRRAGKVVVTGNCHEIRKGIIEYVKEHNLVTIGMSATPLTPGLAEIYEDVVNVTSTVQLIKEEYLAPLHVVAAQAEVDVNGVKVTSTGEWDREQLSDRVRYIVGDVVAEWEHHTTEQFGGPEKTIVFGASVADCEDLARQFQEAGYDFRVLHYKQSVEEKQEIITNFERGLHLGLISCVILTKGFDVPSVRCMVDAYPLRKSLAMHIQKLGRVMRTAPGKSHGLLIDHAGNYYGFMDQANRFFQEGVSVLPTTKPKARKAASRFEGDSKCKSCGYVFQVLDPRAARPSHCPACGAPRQSFGRPKMTVMPGKLEEIAKVDGDLADGIFDGSVDLWTEISCNAMLVAHGEHDKARRIAFAQYKGVTGAWPRGEFMPPDRAPIAAVRDLCLREYRRWKRQRQVA